MIMLNLFEMILLKLLKISMTLIFLFQTFKRCLEFSRIILLHIYFFVWNTIFMYVNLEARNPHLLGTQLISRVIEKLNIILPKRGGNFQIILKNGGSIFNFFFAIPFHLWGSTMCFSALTRLCYLLYAYLIVWLWIWYLVIIVVKFYMFAAIVISCEFCWLLWSVLNENKKYWKFKKRLNTQTFTCYKHCTVCYQLGYSIRIPPTPCGRFKEVRNDVSVK